MHTRHPVAGNLEMTDCSVAFELQVMGSFRAFNRDSPDQPVTIDARVRGCGLLQAASWFLLLADGSMWLLVSVAAGLGCCRWL